MVRSIAKNNLLQCSGIPAAGANFTTVADVETTGFTITNDNDEVYTKDSPNFRQYLTGGGTIKSVDFSGEGVFTNSTDHTFIRDVALYGNPPQLRFRIKDGTLGSAIEGDFIIATFEESASSRGATSYNLALKSNGTVVIASGIA